VQVLGANCQQFVTDTGNLLEKCGILPRMLWLVLKPYPGLADEPSVRQKFCSFRVLLRVAVVCFPLFGSPLNASPASPAGNNNTPESTEVATVEYSTSPPSLREPGSLILRNTSAAAPGYTIRRTAPEVRLQFSAADDRGRLITDLSAGDIRILDDQVPVNRIRQFSRAEDLPLRIGLLLDVSDSVHRTISGEKLATQMFLDRVMRPLSDRAFLMGFGRDMQLWQPATGDIPALEDALQRLQQSGHATSLYDSVFYACLEDFPRSNAVAQGQGILLLFSDGEDTASLHTLAEAIALAQRREIQIYAVSIHRRRAFAPGDAVLRRLADETGGQLYVASSEKDFSEVFTAMETQMRSQYYVSFPPGRPTPGFHDLRIETTTSRSLRIHARQGYYFDAP